MTTITCKIPEMLDAELEAVARSRGTTKSAIVREVLEERLGRGRKRRTLTAYSLAKTLCGSLHGPPDLSANARHMKDFGA